MFSEFFLVYDFFQKVVNRKWTSCMNFLNVPSLLHGRWKPAQPVWFNDVFLSSSTTFFSSSGVFFFFCGFSRDELLARVADWILKLLCHWRTESSQTVGEFYRFNLSPFGSEIDNKTPSLSLRDGAEFIWPARSPVSREMRRRTSDGRFWMDQQASCLGGWAESQRRRRLTGSKVMTLSGATWCSGLVLKLEEW